MKSPDVSIIVPAYNASKYLHKCIKSICQQTYYNFELILVDDGSTDDSKDICNDYAQKDNRIIVVHKENGGVSSARNIGIEKATGKYITFCDADDTIEKYWIEALYSAITKNDADIAVAGLTSVKTDGTIIGINELDRNIFTLHSLRDNLNYIYRFVFGHNHGWEVWRRIFRTDLIKDNGILFPHGVKYSEDKAFVLLASIYAKRICSLSYCGYNYVQNEQSVMNKPEAVFHFDDLTKVSLFVYNCCINSFHELKTTYPVIHYMIFSGQYNRVVQIHAYTKLFDYSHQLQENDWYIIQTKSLLNNRRCYFELKSALGVRKAMKALLFSKHSIDNKWSNIWYKM